MQTPTPASGLQHGMPDEVIDAGDVHAAHASMNAASQARELLGENPDVAGGCLGVFLAYGLDQEIALGRANLSALEGRFDDAEHELATTLPSALTAHHHVTVLAHTAKVRAKAGHPDGACEALGAGLDLAEPAGYTMGVERIRGVRDRSLTRWAGLSCVRALDERLSPRAS
jgi:hypothetical protein